jgi:hypothetical protein
VGPLRLNDKVTTTEEERQSEQLENATLISNLGHITHDLVDKFLFFGQIIPLGIHHNTSGRATHPSSLGRGALIRHNQSDRFSWSYSCPSY